MRFEKYEKLSSSNTKKSSFLSIEWRSIKCVISSAKGEFFVQSGQNKKVSSADANEF